MKNLIKLLLILASGQVWAIGFYRFGYFDHGNATALKVDAVSQWLRDGLRLGGLVAESSLRVVEVSESSTDEQLRGVDFLILRADLASSRALVGRFKNLGGSTVISDRWTREELGIDDVGVLSIAMPGEKRVTPLAGWLNQHYSKSERRGVYLTQADSDFDKIWFYEFQKIPSLKDWTWTEVPVNPMKPKVDFKSFKDSEKLIVADRANSDLLKVLNASAFDADVVMAEDPFQEQPSEQADAFFKKNVMVYYLTVYPKGLTNEARDFERKNKDSLASDAMLHDVLMIAGKALGRSPLRINSKSKFYSALEGLKFNGATGEIFIRKGQLLREIFVVGQHGSERVLNWRSGIVK